MLAVWNESLVAIKCVKIVGHGDGRVEFRMGHAAFFSQNHGEDVRDSDLVHRAITIHRAMQRAIGIEATHATVAESAELAAPPGRSDGIGLDARKNGGITCGQVILCQRPAPVSGAPSTPGTFACHELVARGLVEDARLHFGLDDRCVRWIPGCQQCHGTNIIFAPIIVVENILTAFV